MGFDHVDRQHKPAKKPEITLDPHEWGQDCPMPRCPGKLEWRWPTDQPETGGQHLACSEPGCGWRERDGEGNRA